MATLGSIPANHGLSDSLPVGSYSPVMSAPTFLRPAKTRIHVYVELELNMGWMDG